MGTQVASAAPEDRPAATVGSRLRQLGGALVAALLLLLLAIAVVALVTFALKSLWGELLFAVAVATTVIAIASRLLPTGFWTFLRVPRPRLFEAPIYAATMLVAVPVAIVHRPDAAIVLGGAWLAGFALPLVVLPRERRRPIVWVGCAAAIAGTTSYAYVDARAADPEPPPRQHRVVPVAGADALARHFRPLLFFDGAEEFLPLDIEDAMAGGEVDMCRNTLGGHECHEVLRPETLDLSYDYLRIRASALDASDASAGDRSAYYFHVTANGGRLYLDYWWFFAENPSPVAKRVLCGPGMRTAEATCFQHPADWEGVTVVLASCEAANRVRCFEVASGAYAPEAVHYSQHGRSIGVTWTKLEQWWSTLPSTVDRPLAHAGPLVFVALGSHAAYPRPCREGCRQTGSILGDGPHDGGLAWVNNLRCDGCAKPLPTSDGRPALWNAFEGPWGAQRCILAETYCDVGRAPRAPATQSRFDDPAHVSRWA